MSDRPSGDKGTRPCCLYGTATVRETIDESSSERFIRSCGVRDQIGFHCLDGMTRVED